MLRFTPVRTDDPLAVQLLEAYFTSRALGFTTHAGGYRITHPDPEVFQPPSGVFLVVHDACDQPIGCGGIRRIDDVEAEVVYEVKHIWIDPAARGRGHARTLMAELERRAREFGARLVVLDTNESLTAAQHLYRTSGYVETEPYNLNKNATHWFRKRLD